MYFAVRVVSWIAFGITNAVMRFSSEMTSYMGIESCAREEATRHDGVEAERARARQMRMGEEGRCDGLEDKEALRASPGRTSVIHPKMFAWKQTWFSDMYSLPWMRISRCRAHP